MKALERRGVINHGSTFRYLYATLLSQVLFFLFNNAKVFAEEPWQNADHSGVATH